MHDERCVVRLERHGAGSTSARLEQVHEALWLVEGEIVDFYGFPYPTRSVVVRLEDGDLWIWSPVDLSPGLRDELNRVGPVRHLVSPNKLHHLHLSEWRVAYPAAQLWGPASTIRRRRGLRFRGSLEDVAPREWRSEIDQAWFRGSFAMDEIVFFHRASGTAIVADLIQAFSDPFLCAHWTGWRRRAAEIDGITATRPGAPLEWRLSFLDRAPARSARAKVLGWPVERAVIAHGEWRRSDGHAFLMRALDWIEPSKDVDAGSGPG